MVRVLPAVIALLLAFATTGCTIVRVTPDSERTERGSVLRAEGLVRGHLGVVPPSEDRIINISVLHGQSDGAIAEVIVWKIFRFEAGVAGLSLGLGPLTMGLGTLWYHPIVPASGYDWEDDDDEDHDEHDHDKHEDHSEDNEHHEAESAESMPESTESDL